MIESLMPLADFSPITEERIYVICHGGLISGGPELLHQLVSALVKRNRQAFIVYTPTNSTWITPQEYLRYNCPVSTYVPDEAGVAVIVPEVSTNILFNFVHARQVVWWLSVDYYRGGLIRGWFLLYLVRLFRSGMPHPRRISHLCQSTYAIEFIRRRFSVKGAMLSDYLAQEYFDRLPQNNREKIVAYNPKKGMAYTHKLISFCPDVQFLALENMTREEMRNSLSRCSVYIDFGNHPGKDRIPREAAMCGAIVVVGMKGSARNVEDVSLHSNYKLSGSFKSIACLRALILNIFENYSYHFTQQSPYRLSITKEKKCFETQLEQIFCLDAKYMPDVGKLPL